MKDNDKLIKEWESKQQETKNLAKDLGLTTITERVVVPFTQDDLLNMSIEELEIMLGGMIKHEDWKEAEIVKNVIKLKTEQ